MICFIEAAKYNAGAGGKVDPCRPQHLPCTALYQMNASCPMLGNTLEIFF